MSRVSRWVILLDCGHYRIVTTLTGTVPMHIGQETTCALEHRSVRVYDVAAPLDTMAGVP